VKGTEKAILSVASLHQGTWLFFIYRGLYFIHADLGFDEISVEPSVVGAGRGFSYPQRSIFRDYSKRHY
jgi:hypothetical protein